jgi:hypothetical protein
MNQQAPKKVFYQGQQYLVYTGNKAVFYLTRKNGKIQFARVRNPILADAIRTHIENEAALEIAHNDYSRPLTEAAYR